MLNCYWAMRAIDGLKKGNSQRSWARYLVLYFVWSELSGEIRSSGSRFRLAMENRDDTILRRFQQAAEPVFVAALDYYRKNRVEEGKVLDVPTVNGARKLTHYRRLKIDPPWPSFAHAA